MDATGEILRQRVTELLAARSDLTRADFGRRIGRGHSWLSEFFAGLRTTNDLRLVMKISRVFGVPVGYLLGEADRQMDAGAASLLSSWAVIALADRPMLLALAASLRQRSDSSATPGEEPDGDAPTSSRRRPLAGAGLPKRRR